MSAEHSNWTQFDAASDQALILSAYRAGRINGVRAWEIFSRENLWGDKEEAFFHYINGLETFATQKELWKAPLSFQKAAGKLLSFALKRKIITAASREWLDTLFGLPREANG
jgi:hypothetical protein